MSLTESNIMGKIRIENNIVHKILLYNQLEIGEMTKI